MDEKLVGIADVAHWHEPGVHCVQMGANLVWVRVDTRGIAAMSSSGPQALAPRPLVPEQRRGSGAVALAAEEESL